MDDFDLTMSRIDELISDIDRLREMCQKYPDFKPFALPKVERIMGELESLNVYVDTLWEKSRQERAGMVDKEKAQDVFPEGEFVKH